MTHLAALCLAALLSGPVEKSPEVVEAERLYEEAVAAVQAGLPATALPLFERALTDLPDRHSLRTLALYGAARAAERLNTPEAACRAIKHYQFFSERPDAEAEKQKKAAASRARLGEVCRPPEVKAAQSIEATPPTPGKPSAEPSAPSPAWRPWVGWGAVGLGAAAGVGSAFAWSGVSSSSDAAGRAETRAAYDRHVSEMESRNTAAIALTSVCVALVAGGVAVLLWPAD